MRLQHKKYLNWLIHCVLGEKQWYNMNKRGPCEICLAKGPWALSWWDHSLLTIPLFGASIHITFDHAHTSLLILFSLSQRWKWWVNKNFPRYFYSNKNVFLLSRLVFHLGSRVLQKISIASAWTIHCLYWNFYMQALIRGMKELTAFYLLISGWETGREPSPV